MVVPNGAVCLSNGPVTIRGGLSIRAGATFVLGSEDNPVHTATISGGVHATNAASVQIHFTTIKGGVNIHGGSGPTGGPFDKQAADWGQHPKQHELDTIRRTGEPPFLPIGTRKYGALQEVRPAVLLDLAVAGQSPDQLEERLRLAGRPRLPIDPPAGLAPDRVRATRGNPQHLALAQRPHTVTSPPLGPAR